MQLIQKKYTYTLYTTYLIHGCITHTDTFAYISHSIGASQVVLVVKNPPVNAGDLRDAGLISGSGRHRGEGLPMQEK